MKFEDILIQSISTYEKGKDFNRESSVVYTVLNSNLPKFETDNVWRISISLVEDQKLDLTFQDLSGVIRVYRYFDFERYWNLEQKDRKEVILQCFISTIEYLTEKINLPFSAFKEAFDLTVKQGVKYEGYWNDFISSPDKKYEAKIFISLDFDCCRVEAEIKNSESGTKRKYLLAEPKPHFMFIDRLLGKAFWKHNNEFCLEAKDGNSTLSIKHEN